MSAMDEFEPEFVKAILDTESRFWRFEGAKRDYIREEIGLSATRYYQVLNHIIDTREALEIDPVTVRRLQEKRERHRDFVRRTAS